FLAGQGGLAVGELALALLKLLRPLLEVGAEAQVAPRMCELGLEPVQLGLPDRQLGLTLVELRRALRRLANDGRLVRVVTLEGLVVGAQPLLLEQELGLALAERLILGSDAGCVFLDVGLARREFALSLGNLLVARSALVLALCEGSLAALELDDAGAFAGLEVLLGA